MQEFMLLIRNEINPSAELSPERHLQFVKACESYIGKLKQNGKLIAAQPLLLQGTIISKLSGEWKDTPFNEAKEIQAGYYHILADNMDDAIAIAKQNPEFEYKGMVARIEVRPITMKEETTGFVYPKK